MTLPTLGVLATLLTGWIVCAALMGALWLVATRTRDAGIVDVGWAAGLALLAVLVAVVSPGLVERRLLVAAMGALWGGRLALHLARRMGREGEDGRYRALRRRWGERANALLFPFFQAQAALSVALAVSFLVVARAPRPSLGWLDVAGAVVWCVAVGGEWLADRQLRIFRARPGSAGRTCREGLWAWSRHPNYFFEWLHWLAYVPLAWGSPWWAATLAVALIMLFLILRVTGIPPTEAQALRSRGEDYVRYQRTTSAFFPRPPRRTAGEAPA